MDAQVKPPFGWYADQNHPRNEKIVLSLLFNEGDGVDLVNSAIDTTDSIVPAELGAYIEQNTVGGIAEWVPEGLQRPYQSASRVIIPKENLLFPLPQMSYAFTYRVNESLLTSDTQARVILARAGTGAGTAEGEWYHIQTPSTYQGLVAFFETTTFKEMKTTTLKQIDVGDLITCVFTTKDDETSGRMVLHIFYPDGTVSVTNTWFSSRYVFDSAMVQLGAHDLVLGGNEFYTADTDVSALAMTMQHFRMWNRGIPKSEAYEIAAQPYAGYRSPRIDTRTLAAILAAGGGGAAIDSGPLNIGIGIGL